MEDVSIALDPDLADALTKYKNEHQIQDLMGVDLTLAALKYIGAALPNSTVDNWRLAKNWRSACRHYLQKGPRNSV